MARWRAERLRDGPIIDRHSDPSIGENIQGPSVIRVPAWVASPLGRYYLYFADHKGTYIRLAYANDLHADWHVHVPGSLHLEESRFAKTPPAADDVKHLPALAKLPHSLHKEMSTPHIASPDVLVDNQRRRIVMYFHGLESYGYQASRVSTSNDGIAFDVQPPIVAKSYLRVFWYGGHLYGMAMPGQFYRSLNGMAMFEHGPRLFNPNMRHAALLVRESTLYVFWTQVGDAPERILVSAIDVSRPFENWHESEAYELLRPERDWEGAREPVEPSIRSVAYGLVNQLRDPAILEEEGRVYLFYAVGGESGIGLAELIEE